MKRVILLSVCLLCVQNLTAQEDVIERGKKEWLLRLNFGYNSEYQDNLDYLSQNVLTQRSSNFITDFNLGKRLGNYFYYGIGLSYALHKTEIKPEYPKRSSTTGYSSNTYQASYRAQENTASPYVFVQYCNSLSTKLFIGLDLYSGLDYTRVMSHYDFSSPFYTTEEYHYTQHISVGLVPSFRYIIGSRIGIDLKFGLIDYRKKIDDDRADINNTSSEFNMVFKPENWRLGAFLTL